MGYRESNSDRIIQVDEFSQDQSDSVTNNLIKDREEERDISI